MTAGITPEAADILDTIIKVGAAGAVVWGFIKFVWPILVSVKRAVSRIDATADAVLGTNGEAGIRALQAKQAKEIADLRKEILPNGGGSVSDRMAMLLTWMQSILDADHERGHFSMRKDGGLMWANRLFLRWLNADIGDIEDRGWIGWLHPDDKEAAAYEWDRMIKDERVGTIVARMKNGEGGYIRIVMDCRPQFGSSGHLIGFSGVARILKAGAEIGAPAEPTP